MAPLVFPTSMETGALTPLDRRLPYPAADFDLSALALTVNSRTWGKDESGAVEALRRARALGITTFDTVDSPDRSLAEVCLARAFPRGDPSIVVLTPMGAEPPRPMVSTAIERRAPRAPNLRADLAPQHGATHDLFRRLYEVDLPEAGPFGPPSSPAAPASGPARVEEIVVLRCRSPEDIAEASRRSPPWVLSGTFSLLDRTLSDAASRVLGAGFTWIARDTFAGGRLDGSRFVPPTPGTWRTAPRSLRDLEAEVGTITRLDFLARSKRRTLAQAALHFVHGHPWVATMCIPIPAPERWNEILGFGSSPPLEEEERARADALAGARAVGPFRPEVAG